MKKVALSLMALAVVAAGAFADAPKWDPKVSTGLTGNASATLGYDLDTGIAAFSNGTSVSLFIDLVSGGEAITKSDKDVWGEIRVFTDGDPIRLKADGVPTDTDFAGNAEKVQGDGFQLKVDYAKIHFGKAAYLSVTSHDTKLGYSNSPDLAFLGHWFDHTYTFAANSYKSEAYTATGTETADPNVIYVTPIGAAVASLPLTAGAMYTKITMTAGAFQSTRYGKDEGALSKALDSVGAGNAGGIEFGYTLDKVASLTVDVGSTDAWSTALVDGRAKTNIAYAAKVGILLVDNLTAEVGYSAQTKVDTAKAMGGKLAYTYKIDGDKLYVKPQVGFVNITPDGNGAKAYNSATASILLGTGAKAAQFDNYGLKLDNDYGAYPGVSAGVFYNDQNVVNNVPNAKAAIGLNVSANSGALIKDTTVVASYDVADLNATDLKTAITVGASSSLKAGDVTIAPKGFLVSESLKGAFWKKTSDTTAAQTADSALFAKAAADITGVIPFVTFTVAYESNDLVNGYLASDAGKVAEDKMGKLEFTTKVNF